MSPSYIDISPKISDKTAVFPQDVPFSQNVSASYEQGDHLALSSITTTLHIGAHADAPSHFHPEGKDISHSPLTPYMGLCQVYDVKGLAPKKRIECQDVKLETICAPRVLFRTDSYDSKHWSEDFNSLSPELIAALHSKGVILVGIDTPSVDPADSKALESHGALWQYKVAVLEGLILEHARKGLYDLIALPLNLEKAEASPVRAILLDAGHFNTNNKNTAI